MTDILVASLSCTTAVNRAPYRLLAERGWDVELLVPERTESAGFSRTADPRGPDDPPLHTLPRRGGHGRLWTFEGLPALLDRVRPKIVVVDTDPGSRLAIEAGWWTRQHGGHTAAISCDNMPRTLASELRHGPSYAARLVTARALAGAARLCVDHVFAISQDVARVMGMVGFGRRVSQIPLGFDPELFRPSPAARSRVRHALGLGDEVVFAYFGRLSPEKGVDLFLHALAEMRDEPSWRLMLDEFKEYAHPYAQEVRRLIGELGLDDRIVYVDARHEDVGDFMNAADVVVVYSASNPHWNEQYGRVVPEAMACGRAVVVSDCGALPELAGDAGVVVPQRDVPALAAALRALLHDPARREALGRRGAERALERLSTVVQADLMAEVFRRWTAPSRVAPTRVGVAR